MSSGLFEVPNAKWVRRDELYGSSSDAGSRSHGREARDEEDVEVRARLNERLSRLLGLDLSAPAPAPRQSSEPLLSAGQGAPGGPDDERHDEEFEFRLFATSAKTSAPARVVLAASDDGEAAQGQGGFTLAQRPIEYYVAGEPTASQLERYRCSAVTGEDVLLGARKRAWGLERPWRVTRIARPGRAARGRLDMKTTSAQPVHDGDDNDDEEHTRTEKRKRPGKKRRIATRIKTKAEKEKRETEEKQKISKEEHLMEKKKRLNRERKLKRRAKERGKKLAAKGQEGGSAAPPADTGSDSGSDQ